MAKNKVISINGGNRDSYSEFLEELVKPYFQELFEYGWEAEEIYGFGMEAWNIANFLTGYSKKEIDYYLTGTADLQEFDEVEERVLRKMIETKFKLFNHLNQFIADVSLDVENGKIKIRTDLENKENFLKKIDDEIKSFSLDNDDFDALEDDFEDDFEELNYEEGFIDRLAIILHPRQPFKDWLLKIGAASKLEQLEKGTIYLVDDIVEDNLDLIPPNYSKIFSLELLKYGKEALWPKNRSLKAFREWFEIQFVDDVYDLENFPIKKWLD